MRLSATIRATGKTAAGIVVPDELVEKLGGGRRPPVVVTVRGYTFRSSIARMGGMFMLPVTNETRSKAGLEAGQTADFEIALDTEPRDVTVPEDLAAALAASADARQAFERLSYSNKRRLLIPLDAIKTAEVRARRVARLVAELGG